MPAAAQSARISGDGPSTGAVVVVAVVATVAAGLVIGLAVLAWRNRRRALAAESARAAADRQLQRSQKEMQRFVSAVSHDLRSPLAELDMMLQVLGRQEQLTAGERAAHYTDLRESAQQMRTLIDDLLEHHRAEANPLRIRRCDLGSLIAEAIERHEALLGDAAVRVSMAAGAEVVDVDRERMLTLLGHLLQNAATYGEPPGIDGPVPVEVAATASDGRVRLTVRDRGPGLTDEQRARIFEPFYRVGSGRGTGLGLAIVQRVAAVHGGRAWAEAPADGGTAIIVDLPGPEPVNPPRSAAGVDAADADAETTTSTNAS